MMIADHSLVLFQGDSITDADRDYEDKNSMGHGYAGMIAAWLTAQYPYKQIRFLNQGINGHRSAELRGRWQRDCLDLQPGWVSILIGINDTQRRHGRPHTSCEEYETNYREILRQTQELGAKIIMLEPFSLPVASERTAIRSDLDAKIDIVRQLAREFAALYVPLDGVFAAAALHLPLEDWIPDGIHPTPAGHALIAQQWLKAVGFANETSK